MTDEYKAYSRMKVLITHLSVNHCNKEYVRKDSINGKIHTNMIE